LFRGRARFENLGAAMEAPGLEFADESGVPVRAERVAVAESIACQALADDDPKVSILHLRKA
jgi:hypothetical protein